MNPAEDLSFSRRAFFRGVKTLAATGFLYSLPRVENGFLAPVSEVLGPKIALGAERDAYFTFDVVAIDEVGIQVVDVATLDEKGKPVPCKNVKVTLKSRSETGGEVSGITDEKGDVILDLNDIALRDEDGSLLNDIFQCNCEVIIDSSQSRSKLRELSIGLCRIEGASALVIGAHKLEKDDTCYIERLGFDGWDILYTKNIFARSQENTSKHAVTVRFKSTDSVPVSLGAAWKDKDGKEHSWYSSDSIALYDQESGYYKAVFEGKFLLLNPKKPKAGDVPNKDVWDGDEIDVTVMWTAPDGVSYSLTGTLLTEEAPVEGSEYSSPLKPFLTKNGTLGSISLGNADWPCFNNCDISIVNFDFPLHLSVTAYDLLVSLGRDLQITDDNGKPTGDLWMRSTKQCMRDAYTKSMNRYDKGLAMFGKAMPYEDKDKNPCRKVFAKKFDMKIITQVVLGVQWDKFKGTGTKVQKDFAAKLSIGVGVSAKGSFSWKFMAGPVPCFFTITPGLEVLGAFAFTYTHELVEGETIDLNKLATQSKWVPQGAVSLNIKLYLNLALGVGVEGVLSASLSGGAAVLMYIGWGDKRPREDLDSTHFTVGASFHSEVFLQMICLTVSIRVWNHTWDPFYDNWDAAPKSFAAPNQDAWDASDMRFRLTQPNGSKTHSVNVMMTAGGSYEADGDVFEKMRPVTMETMGHSYEVAAKAPSNAFTMGDATPPAIKRNKIPVLRELEDGTLVTELVDCEGVNTFSYHASDTQDSDEPVADDPGTGGNPSGTLAEDEPVADATAPDAAATDATAADGAAGDAPADAVADATAAEGVPADTLISEILGGAEPIDGDPADAVESVADVTGAVAVAAAGDGTGNDANDAPDDQNPTSGQDGQKNGSNDATRGDDNLVGDTYLGFGAAVVSEYEYEPVEGKTTGAVCGSVGVQAIAAHDGIKPTTDVVIYKDVFSDPRQKIVDIDGTPYLFRIVTVDYSITGETLRRTRVVASAFDAASGTWGNPTVIEYNSGNTKLLRIDMFDYDFDIVVRSEGVEWTRSAYACLVVTGGLRPNGDSTTSFEAFSTPTVSVVLLDKHLGVYQRSVNYVSDLYDDGQAHMLAVPHVCDGFAVSNASGVLAFSYLHRSAASADALMTDEATASFGVGYGYVRDGELSVTFNKRPVLVDDGQPVTLDPSVTGMDLVVGSSVKGKYDSLITLLCHKNNGYEVYSATIPSGGSFEQLQVRKCIDSSETLPHIAAWPRHGTFLFTKYRGEDKQTKKSDYYLYAGDFDPLASNQAGFETNNKRVDLNGFRGGTFCVSPTGSYIFYSETYKDEEESINRIMASKYMDTMGGFSEDFPFCELDHSIDGFEVMTIATAESVFLVNEITNPDRCLSQLRFVSVPHAKVGEIEGFVPIDPFVCAGKPCLFQIDIRNHGNVPLSGFEVTMYDPKKGNEGVCTRTVESIDPDSVIETVSSQRDWLEHMEGSASYQPSPSANKNLAKRAANKSANLTTSEGDYLIMPGELLSYSISFDIPENWPNDKPDSHEKTVLLRLNRLWSPGVMVDPLLHMVTHLHEGVDGTLEISPIEAYANLQDPRETVDRDEPDPEPDTDPDPEPDPYHPSKPSNHGAVRRSLPRTGDPLIGAAAPVGLAIGGLASLMGAYSVRRTEIERERRESEEPIDDERE